VWRHHLVHDLPARDTRPPDVELSSFDWFGSVVLNPLGYALVGPLANVLGVSTTLYLAAVLNAVVSVGVAATPAIRKLERSPRAAPVAT
jgi:hypothetical protein